MLLTYGVIAVLVILIVAVLALIFLVWYLRSSLGQPFAKVDVKTQPVVQRFVSNDLKKRALIVRLNSGSYQVVFQRYSDKVIDQRGDVEGWHSLQKKPIADSLARAVEIAQKWAHTED